MVTYIMAPFVLNVPFYHMLLLAIQVILPQAIFGYFIIDYYLLFYCRLF